MDKNIIIIIVVIFCCSICLLSSIGGVIFFNQEESVLKGRYVQLKRGDGKDEHINILEIEVYDKDNKKITDNIIPTLSPQYGDVKVFGPQFLIDNSAPSNFSSGWKLPHTTASKDAFMRLDLGTEREITRVIIKNRLDCCKERIVGTEIQILGNNSNIKYSSKINQVQDVYEFLIK